MIALFVSSMKQFYRTVALLSWIRQFDKFFFCIFVIYILKMHHPKQWCRKVKNFGGASAVVMGGIICPLVSPVPASLQSIYCNKFGTKIFLKVLTNFLIATSPSVFSNVGFFHWIVSTAKIYLSKKLKYCGNYVFELATISKFKKEYVLSFRGNYMRKSGRVNFDWCTFRYLPGRDGARSENLGG